VKAKTDSTAQGEQEGNPKERKKERKKPEDKHRRACEQEAYYTLS
jgi:hypothetical protein